MKFTSEEIRPNVYHFSFETQYFLNATMMRLQEFYESPFQDIKGKYFSVEKFMDIYAMNMGDNKFSYYTDWSGFNIPGDVALDFFDTFKYDMILKEKVLFDLILLFRHGKLQSKNKNKFYIIATHKSRHESSYIKHELSHAYWYLYPDAYAKEALELLNDKRIAVPAILKTSKEKLKEMGYCDEVIDDELQAYYATSSKNYLVEKLRYSKNAKLSSKFKKLFDSFDTAQIKQLGKKFLMHNV